MRFTSLAVALLISSSSAVRIQNRQPDHPPVKEIVKQILGHFDTNGDGQVSRKEFETVGEKMLNDMGLEGEERKDAERMGDQIFKMTDQDGDGNCTTKEIHAAVSNLVKNGPPKLAQVLSKKGPSVKEVVEEILGEFDLNGDGKITVGEFQKRGNELMDEMGLKGEERKDMERMGEALFKMTDADGSGDVSTKELHNAVSEMFKNGPPKLAQTKKPTVKEIVGKILDEFDHNGDGKVSFDEFRKTGDKLMDEEGLEGEEREDAKRMGKKLFEMTDTNGNGEVSTEELKAAVKYVLENGPPELAQVLAFKPTVKEIVKKILEEFDHNGDGKVSFDEFRKTGDKLMDEEGLEGEEREDAKRMGKKLFEMTDTNGNGEVSTDELKAAVKYVMENGPPELAQQPGQPSVKDIVEQILSHFDLNGDGKVTRKEFEKVGNQMMDDMGLEGEERKDAERMGDQIFKMTDSNGNGEVDGKELHAAVKNLVENGPPKLAQIWQPDHPSVKEIVEQILEHFDTNGDGQVSRKEFETEGTKLLDEMKVTGEERKDAERMGDQIFKMTDQDGDGNCSTKEIHAAVTHLVENGPPEL